jgi:uncharacterized protein
MNYKKWFLILLIVFPPVLIVFSRQFGEMNYFVSSIYKLVFFLPLAYRIFFYKWSFKRSVTEGFRWKKFKRNIWPTLRLSILFSFAFVSVFLIFKGILNFESMINNLDSLVGVNKSNILYIGAYVIFLNSVLEEYFWRGFMFKELKAIGSVKAYLLTGFGFALHHVMLIYAWFSWPYILAITLALAGFGMIMNYVYEKYGLFSCWFIHLVQDVVMIAIGYSLM